mgnify:CR=1
MAYVYITEFAQMGAAPDTQDVGGVPQVALLPAITTQKVAIGGSSASSSGFNYLTRFVRVHTDAICHVVCGASPTATTSNARMAADQTEYFAVRPGQKIAVITGS